MRICSTHSYNNHESADVFLNPAVLWICQEIMLNYNEQPDGVIFNIYFFVNYELSINVFRYLKVRYS